MLTRFLNWLSERADRITDSRLMTIVLAFVAGGLCVSVASATALAVGEGAARWEWLFWARNLFEWADGFFQNFSTEMIGAAITFVLLEVMLARRREKEAEDREKERLILQMGSPFRESAVEAARQLRARGWLTDGSLHGATLNRANLQGAFLWRVSLEKAILDRANLQKAILFNANLQGTYLSDANLQGADLRGANLEGADLRRADLQRVDLRYANLQSTELSYASLPEADLRGANLKEVTLHRANLDLANLRHVKPLKLTSMQGAKGFTVRQLRQADSLQGATLQDGTKLPDDDTWRETFEPWCETVPVDEDGYIIPADLDDAADN